MSTTFLPIWGLMDDMLKDFVVEAMDLAINVEEHLLRLERDPDNKETLNAVFRSFHTIKGGAGFMNLPALVAACHLTENLFDALRNGAAPVTPLAIEAALQASGFVADQLTDLGNGAAPEQLASMPDSLERILVDAIEGKARPPPRCPGCGAALRHSWRRRPMVDWAGSAGRPGPDAGVRRRRSGRRHGSRGGCRRALGRRRPARRKGAGIPRRLRPRQGRQHPGRRRQARRAARSGRRIGAGGQPGRGAARAPGAV
jgi:HPt (histidine-containing phosphotransfer) domain-containing protein